MLTNENVAVNSEDVFSNDFTLRGFKFTTANSTNTLTINNSNGDILQTYLSDDSDKILGVHLKVGEGTIRLFTPFVEEEAVAVSMLPSEREVWRDFYDYSNNQPPHTPQTLRTRAIPTTTLQPGSANLGRVGVYQYSATDVDTDASNFAKSTLEKLGSKASERAVRMKTRSEATSCLLRFLASLLVIRSACRNHSCS